MRKFHPTNGQGRTKVQPMRILTTIIFATLLQTATGQTVYVGSEQPIKTIYQLNRVLTTNDTVLFRRGESFPGELRLLSGCYVSSYGSGAKPILTGLQTVAGWQRVSGDTFEAKAPASMVVLRNGQQQQPARWPNTGYIPYQSATATSVTSSALTGKYNIPEAVIKKVRWAIDRQIATQLGTTLTFTNPSGYTGKPGFGLFLQGLPEFIDVTGEWANTSGTLRMKFNGKDQVQVASFDTIINCGNATGVTINGVQVVGSAAVGIYSMNGNAVTIQNCDIRNCGTFGVYVWNSPKLTLYNNTVTDCLNNGIYIRNNGTSGVTVTDNTLQRIGTVPGLGTSGDLSYKGLFVSANDVLITRNRVDSVGYIGIEFNGNNVQVLDNLVSNFCFVKDDGGGIYTYATNGTVVNTNRAITNNVIINGIGAPAGTAGGTGEAKGIYLDGGTMNVTCSGNVIYNMARSGVLMNNPTGVVFRGNTIYGNRFGIEIVRRTGVTPVTGNVIVSNKLYSDTSTALGFSFYEENLSTSGSADIVADMRKIGVIDSNAYTYRNAYPIDYEYSNTAGATILRPASLTVQAWRALTGHEAAGSNNTATGSGLFIAKWREWLIFNGVIFNNSLYIR